MFRYTVKELETYTDYNMLKSIIVERQSTCTNVYSPLYKRLTKLYSKLQHKEKLTK